jgi:tetratricopeptide (TPR) repeat protein
MIHLYQVIITLITLLTASSDELSCDELIKHGNHELALPTCLAASEDGQGDEIQTWLHLVEIYHSLGQGELESEYLAKIKNHVDFDKNIKTSYEWNRRVGQKYYHSGDYQQAKLNLLQGLSIAKAENNTEWLSKSYNDAGLVALKLNELTQSLNYFQQSLTLKLEQGDAYQLGNTLNNIALVHINLEEYDQATDYYQQALNQYLLYTNESDFDERVYLQISHIYEDLTNAYTLKGDRISAQSFADKIVQTFKLKKSPRAQARALSNIAKYHLGQSQFDEALYFYEAAKAIYLQNNFELEIDFYHDGALISLAKNQLSQALALAQKGLDAALKQQDKNKESQFYLLLSKIYHEIDVGLAFTYLEKHQTTRELFLQEKYDADLNTIQHQIEKQQINHDLVNEQLINANKTAKLQRLTNIILLAVIAILVLITLLIFYVINKKRERTFLLQSIKHHKQQLLLMQNQQLVFPVENNQLNSEDLKQLFKVNLVSLMIDALSIWEKATGTDRIELAEKSKVWTISIDNGTLRTRSLDKYLDLEKVPDNPRWRNVIKTCHFILIQEALTAEDRRLLEHKLDQVLEQVKQLSLLSNK